MNNIKSFIEYYKTDFIKESPDAIIIQPGDDESQFYIADYKSKYSVTFIILADVIIYTQTASLKHYELHDIIKDVLKTNKSIDKIINAFKEKNIFIVNPNIDILNYKTMSSLINEFEFNRTLPQDTYGIVSGRFYSIGTGYISFWEKRNHVKKQMTTVVKMIKNLNYDFTKVKWEMYDHKIKDDVMASFQEYMTVGRKISKQEKEQEEERKRKQIALHIQPGMKRALGQIQPMKQIHPDMPNVKYKQMTTIGDSVTNKQNQPII